MAAAVLSMSVAGPALAREPTTPPTVPAAGGGTGVVVGTPPAGVDLGITAAERASKNQQLDQFKATRTQKKSGGMSPMSSTDVRGALSWSQGLHQQTSYYCVVAVIQTMAYRGISSSYLYYGGASSVREAQDKIYQYVKDPYVLGSDDWLAIKWINNEYANAGLSWRYDAINPPALSNFMWAVKFDITTAGVGSYVRVDLSSGAYAWYQGRSYDRYGRLISVPEHATMAIAFDDTQSVIKAYDPFTYYDSAGCHSGGSYGQTLACNYWLSQSRYFSAMDRVYAASDAPFWW